MKQNLYQIMGPIFGCFNVSTTYIEINKVGLSPEAQSPAYETLLFFNSMFLWIMMTKCKILYLWLY